MESVVPRFATFVKKTTGFFLALFFLEEVGLELNGGGELLGGFVGLFNILWTTFLARLAFEEGASIFLMPNASQGIEKKISTERRKHY